MVETCDATWQAEKGRGLAITTEGEPQLQTTKPLTVFLHLPYAPPAFNACSPLWGGPQEDHPSEMPKLKYPLSGWLCTALHRRVSKLTNEQNTWKNYSKCKSGREIVYIWTCLFYAFKGMVPTQCPGPVPGCTLHTSHPSSKHHTLSTAQASAALQGLYSLFHMIMVHENTHNLIKADI